MLHITHLELLTQSRHQKPTQPSAIVRRPPVINVSDKPVLLSRVSSRRALRLGSRSQSASVSLVITVLRLSCHTRHLLSICHLCTILWHACHSQGSNEYGILCEQQVCRIAHTNNSEQIQVSHRCAFRLRATATDYAVARENGTQHVDRI